MKHFLVCLNHKSLNKEKMDKSKNFWTKLGVSFQYYAQMYKIQTDQIPKPNKPAVDDAITRDTDVF